MDKTKLNILFLLISLFLSCQQKQPEKASPKKNSIQFSERLIIINRPDYKLVKVKVSENKSLQYVLYKNEKPTDINADAYIKVPIQKIACTSTSHLPAFDLLNSEEIIIGFPSTQWIYDSTLVANVQAGLLQDIGQKQGLNQEKLIDLQPDVLMAYQMPGSKTSYDVLERSNIAIVYNADFLETNPLGRAEWIKFTAALIDKEEEADSIFSSIVENYQKYKSLAQKIQENPSVMTGLMYGDTWYVPGGNSYASRFIEDASAQYLWNNNEKTGSLSLGFENVLQKAKSADYWIGVGSINAYQELENTDKRYSLFEAFKHKKIYTYTNRVNPQGGNDYLESGYSRPDLILKDYIKMLHPDINFSKSADFTYFRPLE